MAGDTPFQILRVYFMAGILDIGIGGVWCAVIIWMLVQAALLAWMYQSGGWKKVVL